MNIQGSINQLLVLGAAGIKSNKQLQEYRSAKSTAQRYEQKINSGMATTADYDAYAQLKEEMYSLYPSEERFYEAEEAAGQRDKVRASIKPKNSVDEQIEADKQRLMAKRRSAEEAAAKAQEDLINRQNERMRKDKSINFSSFIEGGLDG
jgi:hypothetical protein